MQQYEKSFFSSSRIAFIAMFSAIAGVLYILNFSLPFAFPTFLEFKFSDIPVLIGTFTLGPLSGAIIVVTEILIKLAIEGSSTLFVGELSDLITTLCFAMTAGIIYKYNRTKKGALIGVIAGSALETSASLLINRFLLVPFYVDLFFGGNFELIVNTMRPLFPSCTADSFYTLYIWASVLPFNLLRCLVASIVTFIVYKHISRLINNVNAKIYGKPDRDEAKAKKANIIIIVCAALLVAVIITFVLLHAFVFRK